MTAGRRFRFPMPSSSSNPAPFVTTRWTAVVAARGKTPEARQALSDLCGAYYAPVITFLRSEGRDADTARELAHEFFARILEKQSLEGATPERGRFRSYLLGALKHFLANRRAHESRAKRGQGAVHEPLAPGTDTSPGLEIADLTRPGPDAAFDREWAVTLLERALGILAGECAAAGRRPEYDTLKPWLTGEGGDVAQAEAARALGLTENAVRVAIHRLRRRFRELVRAEIAVTLADPADIARELEHLQAALRG